MGRLFTALASAALACLAAAGAVHGVRAAGAFADYHRAKWGSGKDRPELALDLCARARSQYPWNYRACEFAADTALDTAGQRRGEEQDLWLERAEEWSEDGLRLNPYDGDLRLVKTRVLETASLREALDYWKTYVDWEYWDPFNHAVLADLYARAGDLVGARHSHPLVKGSVYYEWTRLQVERAEAAHAGVPPR